MCSFNLTTLSKYASFEIDDTKCIGGLIDLSKIKSFLLSFFSLIILKKFGKT